MIARERLSLHADRPESLFQVVHGHSPRKRGAPSLGSHTLDSRRRRRKIRYALMAAFGLAVCLLLLLINAESVRKLALDGSVAAVWWQPRVWVDSAPQPLREIRAVLPLEKWPRSLRPFLDDEGWLRPPPAGRKGSRWAPVRSSRSP